MKKAIVLIFVMSSICYGALKSRSGIWHGQIEGINQHDHVQYLPISGITPMFGNLDMNNYDVQNVGSIDANDGQMHEIDVNIVDANYIDVNELVLPQLTASRLIYTDSNKKLTSVANLQSWIAGTANQINTANDGDGTITLSTPQDINTTSNPTFAGININGDTNSTGDTYWVGEGSGVPFAEIYVKDSVATISVDADNPDTIVTQFTTNGLSNNCTANAANDKITITVAGKYCVRWNAVVELDAGVTTDVVMSPYLNGVIQNNLHQNNTVSTTDKRVLSGAGFIDVTTVPWDLDVRANITSAAARNLTVSDININVSMVGGT